MNKDNKFYVAKQAALQLIENPNVDFRDTNLVYYNSNGEIMTVTGKDNIYMALKAAEIGSHLEGIEKEVIYVKKETTSPGLEALKIAAGSLKEQGVPGGNNIIFFTDGRFGPQNKTEQMGAIKRWWTEKSIKGDLKRYGSELIMCVSGKPNQHLNIPAQKFSIVSPDGTNNNLFDYINVYSRPEISSVTLKLKNDQEITIPVDKR